MCERHKDCPVGRALWLSQYEYLCDGYHRGGRVCECEWHKDYPAGGACDCEYLCDVHHKGGRVCVSSTRTTQWVGLCDGRNMNNYVMYTTGVAGGACEQHKDYPVGRAL